MLTVDFTKFPVNPGDRVLDLGCGAGRHAFEAYRRGAHVVAADLDSSELTPVRGMFADGMTFADLIESGNVELESGEGFGEPVVIETIGAGDLLGWSWMFPPYVWHFTARAAEPT